MALAEFIVSFREVFEIALIVGIMLACLEKTKNAKHARLVWLGVALALVASVAVAYAFETLAGGYEEHGGLFEAGVSIASGLLVGALAAIMLFDKGMGKRLEEGMKTKAGAAGGLGIVLFAFVNILHEGVEIVLMLGSVWLSSRTLDIAFAAAGAIAAVLLAYAVIKSVVRLDMGKFFRLTGALLALLAAWLLVNGVAEFAGLHS